MPGTMKLASLDLSGYKSIDGEGQTIYFGDLTVLLGANGAGKSNLVSFFKMTNYMINGNLQLFIGEQGYADSILFYGAKKTSRMRAKFTFKDDLAEDIYQFTLSPASGDTMIFTEENVTWKNLKTGKLRQVSLDAGHKESKLHEEANSGGMACKFIINLMQRCQFFQFHDTSATAKIRNQGYINDNGYLRGDAGNLAAYLYALKEKPEWEKYYQRIVRHIQQIVPQFGEFNLKPSTMNPEYIRLDWREQDSDYLFGPHQLSDGTLRFMAMTTLLLQPPERLPRVIVLDEPELGLHPSAIAALAGMAKAASHHCQLILATQSMRLIDEFNTEDIVVVEREGKKGSVFKRLDPEKLAEWLQRYSLSELWEKNVLGGRP